MTYTTAHKTYQGETLAIAAAAMLLDEAVWKINGSPFAYPKVAGEPKGYSVESWSWDAEKHELTVNFR